ncbi:MAG: SpoIIE family protein phosphatase [Candidatus Micrarchaeota archaeon]
MGELKHKHLEIGYSVKQIKNGGGDVIFSHGKNFGIGDWSGHHGNTNKLARMGNKIIKKSFSNRSLKNAVTTANKNLFTALENLQDAEVYRLALKDPKILENTNLYSRQVKGINTIEELKLKTKQKAIALAKKISGKKPNAQYDEKSITAHFFNFNQKKGLTNVNAGHEAPIHLYENAQGKYDYKILEGGKDFAPGIPLGIYNVEYQEKKLAFPKNSIILAYTDGLLDRQVNGRNTLLGDQGRKALAEIAIKILKQKKGISMKKLAKKIHNEIREKYGKATDDEALLVFRRKAA